MKYEIKLKKADTLIVVMRGGNAYEITQYDFETGRGLRVEPIAGSYVPVCKSLAERQDLVDHQKNIDW